MAEQLPLVGVPAARRRRTPSTPTSDTPVATRLPVARVVVDTPHAHLDRPFEYVVPAELDDAAQPGVRVRVRFYGRDHDGYLVNRVEAAETRRNSQLAREIRVALPAELDHAERVELVRDFCQRSFVDRGMVADIALHAPGLTGDERNHHAHILLTTREIDAEGFTAKNRDWNAVEVLEGWREAWAVECNAALEHAGTEVRVDHRTLVEQRSAALERAVDVDVGGVRVGVVPRRA